MSVTAETVAETFPSTSTLSDSEMLVLIAAAHDLVFENILAPYTEGDDETVDGDVDWAVLHQIGQWLETGEMYDILGLVAGTSFTVGDVTNIVPARLSPRSARLLRKHNLTRPFGA